MTNTFKAVTAYFKQSIQTDGQAVRQLDRRTVRQTYYIRFKRNI